jgi:hypothetical protein
MAPLIEADGIRGARWPAGLALLLDRELTAKQGKFLSCRLRTRQGALEFC